MYFHVSQLKIAACLLGFLWISAVAQVSVPHSLPSASGTQWLKLSKDPKIDFGASSVIGVNRCCAGGAPGGVCALVLCKAPEASQKLAGAVNSRKLFEGFGERSPENVCQQCAASSSPICQTILCRAPSAEKSRPQIQELFRRDLERVRILNDYFRSSGDVSPEESLSILEAYKKDMRENYLAPKAP